MEPQLAQIRAARQRREIINQRAILEETTLRHLFHDRVIQIRNKISTAKDLREMMRLVRITLESLGAESSLGVCGYRYSRTTNFMWSATRDKLQGNSRYFPDPAPLNPGEKKHFIETAGERGYPMAPTDILLVDRFNDFKKMSPEDRAQAEADLEADLVRYFGAHYREDFANDLENLREALRYNLYIRWPGFDQYDMVIMANNHVHNAQLVKAGFPPEPLFHDHSIKELFFESLRDLQIPYTSKLREVENGRKAELRLLRGDALHKLQAALDQGQTPQELFEITLGLLPQLFPRTAEESYVERSSVMLFDEDEGRLSIVAARGLRDDIVKNTHLLPGENLAGRVFKTGIPLLVLDAFGERKDVFSDRALPEQLAKGACMSVPILSEGKTYGVLNVRSRRIKAFREEELRFFETVAGILANKMRRLSLQNRDEDTGLYLRKPGVRRVNNMLEKALCEGLKLAFIMIDLDKFKRINDRYGHEAGDKVIAASTRIIMEVARRHKKEFSDHVVIRWGNGEEFVVAVLGTDASQAMALAEEIRLAIQRQSHKFLGPGDFVTASFGISLYPDHGTVLEEIARHADAAVYRSKDGRNRVTFYDPTDRNLRDSTIP
ncbi:GGDEF domain-containing protein [Candidatus Saganbacteria bacterium]|nr:GGDEF domain-containing protein [Candidatus Saganbacteria bacterium]